MWLQSCFLLGIAVVGTFSELLEKGKIYSIQNAHDGTHLEVVGTGKLCERLSEVITSKNLQHDSESFRWKYRPDYFTQATFFIDSKDYNHSYTVNEVTHKEQMGSPPLYCYPELAKYDLSRVDRNTIQIKSADNNKCLTGNGAGKQISWQPCQHEMNQFWHFIDLEKPIVKFFEDRDGKGDVIHVQLKTGKYECYNFPSNWNDKISSIDTAGQCIVIFDDRDCTGESSRITPGPDHHGNLYELLWFSDKVTSVKAC